MFPSKTPGILDIQLKVQLLFVAATDSGYSSSGANNVKVTLGEPIKEVRWASIRAVDGTLLVVPNSDVSLATANAVVIATVTGGTLMAAGATLLLAYVIDESV